MGYSSTWSYGRSIQTNSDGTQLDSPQWNYGKSRMFHLMSGSIHELAGVVSGVSSLIGHLSIIQSLLGVINALSSLTGNLIILIRSSFEQPKLISALRPGKPSIIKTTNGSLPEITDIDDGFIPEITGK